MMNIDTSSWKEFKLSDFFEIKTTKGIDKGSVAFVDNGVYDFIGRTSENNGIQGRVNYLGFEPYQAHSFSLVQVGESKAIWRECQWYPSQNIFILIPKQNKVVDNYLFFQSVINTELKTYNIGYNTYPTLKTLNETTILLPAKEIDVPDWDYMSELISELEEERISELSAYLEAAGLDDYELTEEDKEVLSLFEKTTSSKVDATENDCGIRMKEFRIGDLFTSQNGNVDIKKEHINEKGYPVVSSGIENTGVIGTTDLPAKIFPKNTITVDMFGNAFYRDFEYKMVTHARVFNLQFIDNSFDKKAGLFFVAALKKVTQKYTYDNMCSFEKIKNKKIELPVKENDTPDWDYMDKYIRAIEKQTIADVVKYKDDFISAAKSAIGVTDGN